MPTLYLLFSHTVTPEQQADATASLGVGAFVPLPPELQALFGNVPPDLESLDGYLQPIRQWLAERVQPADFVLIQGDFGVTFSLVAYCLAHALGTPVYATTQRQAVEAVQPDGSVVTQRVFRHCRFRRYQSPPTA